MVFRKIGVASDHAGKELKELIVASLRQMKVDTTDLGVGGNDPASVDYPDYAGKAAQAVSTGQLDGAIAICGTGIGMAITANKFPRVRAASAWDAYSCKMGREHNDSNILCLGARTLAPAEALNLVKLWLATPFAGGRHADRVAKIHQLEAQASSSPCPSPSSSPAQEAPS